MGLFSKLFKGPEIDMEKSNANAKKMRALFNQVVEDGDDYRLIFGYTEDVSRFNYGFVHGSKTKIGNLIVGWNEASQTIVVLPTVPDLSGCGDPTYYRRSEILKAYRNKYPTDSFIIYPDKKEYIGINAYDWLEDEKLYVYVSQEQELAAFTDFFMNQFATKWGNHAFRRNRSTPAVSCGGIYIWQSVVSYGRSNPGADQKAIYTPQTTPGMAYAPP